jgi:ATP-dependent DNA helicase DinG
VTADAGDLLGPEGPFAHALTGFAPRGAQQDMARAVQSALATRSTLVCEAGTGIGKTFAYLVPALLAHQRVVVSTGTRHLQDQLFGRDLPTVRRALGMPVDVTVLKGRANYLCLHRLERTLSEGRLGSRAEAADLRAVQAWAARTRTGDLAEVEVLGDDSPLLPRVTSTADNCLGTGCARFEDCHFVRARRRAQAADVVVINHHLLLADLVLKEEGFAALLPEADAVIVDEAHQLADLAAQYFGTSITARQLTGLADDARAEWRAVGGEDAGMTRNLDSLDKSVKDLRLAFGLDSRRGRWEELAARAEVRDALDTLQGALRALGELLATQAAAARPVEQLAARAGELAQGLERFLAPAGSDEVLWFETWPRSFALHATPLDGAARFGAQRAARPAGWVFTSATLAVDGDFSHFRSRLGLEDAEALQFDSPFDYAQNAVLYLPTGLPAPDAPGYTQAVIEAALPLIEANAGGTFLLFTSHRALGLAHAALSGRTERLVLRQGDAPRARLLERFRAAGDAVLLGTSSFWEGVDVRGHALSLVVIDKLPFASPGDPLLAARLERLRAEGEDPFNAVQVPQAVIALKQGAGRLIRAVDDVGVLMVCDPRLTSRGYGKAFLRSLPPMAPTREREVALGFLRNRSQRVLEDA